MPLRVGLDLVAVDTVEKTLSGAHAAHYLERVYTQREVDDCRDSSDMIDPMRLAARFAAKEAAIKALPGAGEGLRLTTIEVVPDSSGAVRLQLSGHAAELAKAAGITELALSITHDSGFAAAAVVTH
jgi:holo-[acyl-carrier protein] synthase